MLEDDFTYVIRKALAGHQLAPAEAAARAGLAEADVLALTRGQFSADVARQLAPVLHLNPAALAVHAQYSPAPLRIPNVYRLDLPFGQEQVNAWLICAENMAFLFDTGFDPNSCTAAVDAIGPPPLVQVFITHDHVDHIGGIRDFLARGVVPYGAMIEKAKPMQAGDSLRYGSLTVRACDLSGHATPALGYFIDGLEKPVLVTGDALFAGSMGGCASPAVYQHALSRLRDVLAPLSDDTVLLPGHGPATTLGEERTANPFL